MPYFYNVEKKIGANIVILTLIGIISFSVCIYLFISNYIQKKKRETQNQKKDNRNEFPCICERHKKFKTAGKQMMIYF